MRARMMIRLWWRLRYTFLAMRALPFGFRTAWYMSGEDQGYYEGETPKDALEIELSYWEP